MTLFSSVVYLQLPPVDVVKGSSALFECEIAGTSPFEVTWHKDGKEIKPSAKHGFSILNGTVALEVHKCNPSDVGEYQCTAANEVGSCTCKTTLSLKGRFPLQSWEQNLQWGQTQTHSAGQLCVRRNRTAREIRRRNLLVQTDQFSWKL
uniref:Ig-like domain-containing protein n=1 Tax=Oryzias latipes TaxID=8090 RepID=A0A3B3HV95_ORYLA